MLGIWRVSHFGYRSICATIILVQSILLICFSFWVKYLGMGILGNRIDLSLTLFKKILPDYCTVVQLFYALSRKIGNFSFSPAHPICLARVSSLSILVCGDISCDYISFIINYVAYISILLLTILLSSFVKYPFFGLFRIYVLTLIINFWEFIRNSIQ